jgi:hypothetical protein
MPDAAFRYPSSKLLDFFNQNRVRLLSESVEFAQNGDGETACLTSDNGSPCVQVYGVDGLVYQETAHFPGDLEEMADFVYTMLFPNGFDASDEPSLDEMEELVNEREADLYNAALQFLRELMQAPAEEIAEEDDGNFADSFLEDVCQLLSSEYGVSVYRPSIEQEEDGEPFLVEFPYGN